MATNTGSSKNGSDSDVEAVGVTMQQIQNGPAAVGVSVKTGTDTNGGGLSVATLMRTATQGKATSTRDKLTQRLAAADRDGDGVLDHEEVLKVVQSLVEEEVSKRNWRKAAFVATGVGLLMMLLLIAAVVGLVAVVVVKTKDTKAEGNVLVNKNTGAVLGTASQNTTYVNGLDLFAPIAQLSSLQTFVTTVNGREVVLSIRGLLRVPGVLNPATKEFIAEPYVTLYTNLGPLTLKLNYKQLELAYALKELGVDVGELAPLNVTNLHRRRLQAGGLESCEATGGSCPSGYEAGLLPPGFVAPPGTYCRSQDTMAPCTLCSCRGGACATAVACGGTGKEMARSIFNPPPPPVDNNIMGQSDNMFSSFVGAKGSTDPLLALKSATPEEIAAWKREMDCVEGSNCYCNKLWSPAECPYDVNSPYVPGSCAKDSDTGREFCTDKKTGQPVEIIRKK